MPRQVSHFALRGGLDLVSSPLVVEPGRAWSQLNYVPVEAGYQRIAGYERKDGRPSPSDAQYWLLAVTLGSQSAASVDATLLGTENFATAVVLKVEGSTYVLGEVVGTVAADEQLVSVASWGSPQTASASDVDLNSLASDGVYLFSAAATNKPTGATVGVVAQFPDPDTPTRKRQIAVWGADSRATRRQTSPSTWQSWSTDAADLEPFSITDVNEAPSHPRIIRLNADGVPSGIASIRSDLPSTYAIIDREASGTLKLYSQYHGGRTWERLDSLVGTANGASPLRRRAGEDIDDDLNYLALAASHRRDAIRKVPGSGPVRGVWFYNNDLYAFRDVTGANPTSAKMFKATSSGWSEVSLGVALNFDGGTTEPLIGDRVSVSGGAVASLAAFTLTSGTWTGNDAAGTLYLLVESGTFADDDTLRRGGSGNEADFATAAGTATDTTLPAGGSYRFVNHNFRGQAASEEMYGVNGVGKAFHYGGIALVPIATGHADDKPTHIAVHRNHLALAYRGGSLIVSETGNPDGYSALAGAAEIACGQDINGLAEGIGSGNTLIMGADRMQVLYGNDSADFQLADMSEAQTGGVEGTLQQVGGPLYMDNRGVRSVATTQAYGNFVIGTMTAAIQPWIDLQREERNVTIGSLRVRSRDQYRVWFASGIGLCVYLGRGTPEISFIDYGSDDEIGLGFDEGAIEPTAGHLVTGATSDATARIDSATVASGSWTGNDAAGTLRLFDVRGTFQDDESLQTSAGTIGRVNGTARHAANNIYPACSVSAEDSARIERVYFGANNGFVYEAERGRSFDGREIRAYSRLPLNHVRMPSRQKRFHSADLHLDLKSRIKLGLSAIYEDGTNPDQLLAEDAIYGGGGLWEEGFYDEFYWNSPLNGYHTYDLMGIGRNVSILLLSRTNREPPHTLNGVSLHWSARRGER